MKIRTVIKMVKRSIRAFPGRYAALLFIVALSAGFFAGLKVTKDAMVHTGDVFLTEQKFYDFRLFSTLGFTGEDVKRLEQIPGVSLAEGTNTVDLMLAYHDSDRAYKVLALPEKINLPALAEGRMPENASECLGDKERFSTEDLGKVISVSGDNKALTAKEFAGKQFTLVGLVDSPLYLGIDRGSTDIGSGVVHSFLYVPKENFSGDVFSEVSLVLKEKASLYSDEYNELVEDKKEQVMKECEALATERYEELLQGFGLTPEQGAFAGIEAPETFVLTRSENAGYVNFKNDTAIVSGIANIFPVFFILIAILVCMTTMTRMVDEERTQIGVLKALGYGTGAIMSKYLLYAGSATIIGWAIGFFFCTWGIPKVFWIAYNALYDFAPLAYMFRLPLAAVTLAVSLAGILGSTYVSCRRELVSVPATLIRPRAAKNGKRIFLERIPLLWRRFSFLQKITVRNMFRYKKRLVMMVIGISCCAGLVVTAFGAGDSMRNISKRQFSEVQTYDMEVSFLPEQRTEAEDTLKAISQVKAYLPVTQQRVEVLKGEIVSGVTLYCVEQPEHLSEFWDLHEGDERIAYPKKGEVVINAKLADRLEIEVGDSIEVRNTGMEALKAKVSGIFDNYIYNYLFVSEESYKECFEDIGVNTLLLSVEGEGERVAEDLTRSEAISNVSMLSTLGNNIETALSCLDYIILMVVLFAGALAFVVIFNLTNINLAERSREIATVQVLGFYPKETQSYVLRENLILSVIASIVGLPVGILFHRAVMMLIRIDLLKFPFEIAPKSYVYSFLCTVLFAVVVNMFMRRQIEKIPMAESLKAVE